ncbi:MAG: glycosyltransferase family 39 protein [Planctomycetaceae bacterium]
MWLLLIIALGVRLLMACGVQFYMENQVHRDFLIAGDAAGYWELATQLADGEPYEIYTPPRQILRMPGFPLVLALPVRLSDASFLVARLWLALIGTLAVYLTFQLAREWFDRQAAFCAGWIVALHPVLAGFSVLILSETSFAAALLASLWCFTRLQKKPNSISLALTAGLLAAVATYMRPVWLLFPAIWGGFALIHLPNKRMIWRNLFLVHLAMGLALAPWIYRNYQVSGHLVVTTLWAGPSLYDGLNPAATGASNMQFFEVDNLSARMSEYEVDREYRSRAWQFVRENPQRTLELAGIKLFRFWRPWPSAEEVSLPPVVWSIGLLNTLLFLCLMLAVWKYRRESSLLFYCLAPVLFFSLLHLLFVGSLRYRLPAEYPLLILVGEYLSNLLCRNRIGGVARGDYEG